MSFNRISLALATLAFAALALVPTAATAATNCKLTKDEEYHKANNKLPTYTRKLSVSGGATCSQAHKFIRAYYKCRVAKPSGGKKGKCTEKVSGYSCTEKRFNEISAEYDANVACKNGKRRINTQYTQFT